MAMEKQELEEQSSEVESHGAGGAGMKIDRCPHCGSDEDYFTKDFAYGNIRSYSRFDGKEAQYLKECLLLSKRGILFN